MRIAKALQKFVDAGTDESPSRSGANVDWNDVSTAILDIICHPPEIEGLHIHTVHDAIVQVSVSRRDAQTHTVSDYYMDLEDFLAANTVPKMQAICRFIAGLKMCEAATVVTKATLVSGMRVIVDREFSLIGAESSTGLGTFRYRVLRNDSSQVVMYQQQRGSLEGSAVHAVEENWVMDRDSVYLWEPVNLSNVLEANVAHQASIQIQKSVSRAFGVRKASETDTHHEAESDRFADDAGHQQHITFV